MDQIDNKSITWLPAKKILFRFFFSYFFFYCFPYPIDGFDFLTPVAQPYYNFVDWLIPLISQKWFHLNAHISFPGFDKVDDSYYGLVFFYLIITISLVVTLVWSLIDRDRNNYEKLYRWLKLYLRFFLIGYLLGYGFIKVFPSQFQEITASRLTMTVGDQSPMLLAWNFLGYSLTLMKINGFIEVLAGLLLLFRRTTTLGAILSACTFGFIVTMDFCFNIPVRLLASHLLFMSLFLIYGDRNRLLNIFILNKPTVSAIYQPLIVNPVWRKIFSGLLVVLAISLLYSSMAKGIDSERSFGRKAARVPLYGVYDAIYFLRNNDTIPALATDSLRWKRLVIDGGSWNQSGIIQFSTGKRNLFTAKIDTLKNTLALQSESDTTQKYLFHYFLRKDKMLVKGVWDKDSIEILMNKYDLNNYVLHSEKFKWITD
jgi:hypothetical protein